METQSSGDLQSSTYSGSSKTGSTAGDGDKQERDFSKDNRTSPIDLECHIQAERITKILDELLYKTKLALCLASLVQEYSTLHSILSDQHMDDLIFIFEQYDNPLFSTSLLNMAAMEDIKQGDVSLKNRLNPELGHLLYIMNSYPALQPKVDEMINEMKKEYAAGDQKRQQPGVEYLLALEKFRELMVVQLATTAGEELGLKLTTRKLQGKNDDLLAEIRDCTTTLKVEQTSFEDRMKQKGDLIALLEQELRFLNHEASVKLQKKILDSDRQMVLQSRSHAVKSEMLKEEEEECKEGYETLLRRNLMEEKSQRARRFKVETQLLSWLQKYDLEMGDKQVELDEFTEKYEEEVQKCEVLEGQLAEQDKEYIPLMEEREKEYHQEMTEKMNKFLLEHAARVIQNAWRDVLANRAEKKKLKKLQKKMAAAAILAEKRAEAERKLAKKMAKQNAG